MAGENVEFNAFLQMNETLSTGIREALLGIAEAALSRKLIHENTHSEVLLTLGYPIEVRSQNFLKAIRDRIRIDPQAFHVFVSILESQHSMEYLGIKLKESLDNQKEDLKKRQALAAAHTHTNSSSRQVEMVLSKGQPITVTRPTQLVAPGEQLHSYTRMQHVQLPAKPATFASLSHNHSGAMHRSSLTTHPANGTTMSDHEPWSEPVIKYTTSPGMVFRKNIVLGAASREDNNKSSTSDAITVTRRAVTPGPEASDSRRISSCGLTGKNIPRTFEKNYSDLQQRLDLSKIQDRPLSIEAPKHINTHQYPVPVTSSDNHSPPSIASKLKRLSITTDPTNIGTAGDTHMVFQASSANTGKLFTLPPPTDENTTTHFLFTQRTGSTCYSDAEYHLPNGTLEQLHGVCTPTQGNRNTGPSGNTSQLHLNRTSLDKCTDGHENLTSNTAITTPMPTEPTMVPPNPPTAAGLIKDNGSNGVKESQTTIPGSDSLTYDHNVMRTPSLQSGSSIDSTDDSAEVDPIQASEDDHYAMITSGGIKPASCSKGVEKQKRQRCKHCVKYKEETNVLKVELNKLQRTLSREREQSNAQVASLREEIYHVEQHANYEITQCQIYVHNAEVRHQDAARTIQRLQRELQLVGKERDSIKNAYDSCLERCHMLEAELQRVDSMQCPEHHEQYDNTIAPNPISQQPNYYSVHTPRQSGVRHITTSLDD